MITLSKIQKRLPRVIFSSRVLSGGVRAGYRQRLPSSVPNLRPCLRRSALLDSSEIRLPLLMAIVLLLITFARNHGCRVSNDMDDRGLRALHEEAMPMPPPPGSPLPPNSAHNHHLL